MFFITIFIAILVVFLLEKKIKQNKFNKLDNINVKKLILELKELNIEEQPDFFIKQREFIGKKLGLNSSKISLKMKLSDLLKYISFYNELEYGELFEDLEWSENISEDEISNIKTVGDYLSVCYKYKKEL